MAIKSNQERVTVEVALDYSPAQAQRIAASIDAFQRKQAQSETTHQTKLRQQAEVHAQRLAQAEEKALKAAELRQKAAQARILANTNSWSRRMTDSLDTIKNSIIALGVAFVGAKLIETMKNLSIGALSMSADFEYLEGRLIGLYGSVGRASIAFENFLGISTRTPFDLRQVVEAGAQLKAFGVDADRLTERMADLAAFMGEDMVTAANSFGRAWAGGVGAADIFRERGINNLIASFNGIKDITKVGVEEYRQALLNLVTAIDGPIAGSADRLSKTYLGAFSNLKDQISILQDAIGDEFRPKITLAFKDLSDWMQKNSGDMVRFAASFGDAVLGISKVIGKLVLTMWELRGPILFLAKATLTFFSLKLGIEAITKAWVAATAAVNAYNNAQFKKTASTVFNAVPSTGATLGDYIKQNEALKSMQFQATGAGKAVGALKVSWAGFRLLLASAGPLIVITGIALWIDHLITAKKKMEELKQATLDTTKSLMDMQSALTKDLSAMVLPGQLAGMPAQDLTAQLNGLKAARDLYLDIAKTQLAAADASKKAAQEAEKSFKAGKIGLIELTAANKALEANIDGNKNLISVIDTVNSQIATYENALTAATAAAKEQADKAVGPLSKRLQEYRDTQDAANKELWRWFDMLNSGQINLKEFNAMISDIKANLSGVTAILANNPMNVGPISGQDGGLRGRPTTDTSLSVAPQLAELKLNGSWWKQINDEVDKYGGALTAQLTKWHLMNPVVEKYGGLIEWAYTKLKAMGSPATFEAVMQGFLDIASAITTTWDYLIEAEQNRLNAQQAANQARIDALNGELEMLNRLGFGNTMWAKRKEKEAAEAEKKDSARLRRLQKERQQLAIADATINAIASFATNLKAYPFPLSAIMGGLSLAAGMAQVSAIASQEFALGGKVRGNPYGDRTQILAQGGEYVINQRASERNANVLESMNNGATVGGGRSINITINGNVIGEDRYVRERLIPEISRALEEGHSLYA